MFMFIVVNTTRPSRQPWWICYCCFLCCCCCCGCCCVIMSSFVRSVDSVRCWRVPYRHINTDVSKGRRSTVATTCLALTWLPACLPSFFDLLLLLLLISFSPVNYDIPFNEVCSLLMWPYYCDNTNNRTVCWYSCSPLSFIVCHGRCNLTRCWSQNNRSLLKNKYKSKLVEWLSWREKIHKIV